MSGKPEILFCLGYGSRIESDRLTINEQGIFPGTLFSTSFDDVSPISLFHA